MKYVIEGLINTKAQYKHTLCLHILELLCGQVLPGRVRVTIVRE